MSKKVVRWITFVLAMCMMLALPVTANAECSLPDEIYLTQSASGRCTISSAAMMIRSRLYLSDNDLWKKVTESSAASYGWLSGAGLIWNWTYKIEDCSISIGRNSVSGISSDELKAILDEHPEGIVLYVSSVPHAVFLTDYEDDTFYCADPSSYYSGKRIPLDQSWTAKKCGDQADVLERVSSYWYVKSYSIPGYTEEVEPEVCECSEEFAGEYICTASTYLNIRSGHSTSSEVVGSIPSGATVDVTMAGEGWAHVEYNSTEGYAYMEYLKASNSFEEPDEEDPVEGPRPVGDVTGDEMVSNSDLVLLCRYIVGLVENEAEIADIIAYGDMDGDDAIANTDIVIMTQGIIGVNE